MNLLGITWPLTLLSLLCYAIESPSAIELQTELTVMIRPDRVAKATEIQTVLASSVLSKYNARLEPMFKSGTTEANQQLFHDPLFDKYYTVEGARYEDFDSIIKELRALEDIQTAYLTPPATLPVAITKYSSQEKRQNAQATPNFLNRQGYLRNALAGGLNVDFSLTQRGGQGDGVQVFDIEYAWLHEHEDLQLNWPALLQFNYSSNSTVYVGHGTAVAGVIGGDDNNIGVQGIVPNAQYIASGVFPTAEELRLGRQSVASAIRAAASSARAGDVILLEMQRGWRLRAAVSPVETILAVEWWPQDFDAIRAAINRGVVVVEAAANGAQDFDDLILRLSRQIPQPTNPNDNDTTPFGDVTTHPDPFNVLNPSSGAIIVGAGGCPLASKPPGDVLDGIPDRARLGFSNYGARVDVQAWGQGIWTTGVVDNPLASSNYCDGFNGNSRGSFNKCYTRSFSGTSGASAIIAGVTAAVQGVLKANNRKPLTSQQFIQLYRNPLSGDPQVDITPSIPAIQRIGSRPDMARLIPLALAMSSPA